MKLVPYDAPRLPEFRTRGFRGLTLRWRERLERRLFPQPQFHKGLHDVWVRFAPHKRPGQTKTKPRAPWQPKLYLCVNPKHYWPILERLILNADKLAAPWKFYMAPTGYDRPDKIVFYAHSEDELKRLVKRLRPLLRGLSFHDLRHVAPSSQLGLESPRHEGVYVGCDPSFLSQSWRIYRSHCVAWASLNKKYLENQSGGSARWYERMNLSLWHEGPATLSPDRGHLNFIRRYWRIVSSPG